MAVHGVAFYGNNNAAALTAIPPVADETVFVSDNDLMVPEGHAAVYAAAGIGDALDRVVLDSPLIRTVSRHELGYVDANAAPEEHSRRGIPFANRLPVKPGEALNVLVTNTGNAATGKYVGIWFEESAVNPTTGADFRTVRGTTVLAAAANVWSSAQIKLDVDLPAGTYTVVGFRVVIAGGIFARLIFPRQGMRPMAICSQANGQDTGEPFRDGRFGPLGEFQNFVPPKLEILPNVAVNNPIVYLDVVRRGA